MWGVSPDTLLPQPFAYSGTYGQIAKCEMADLETRETTLVPNSNLLAARTGTTGWTNTNYDAADSDLLCQPVDEICNLDSSPHVGGGFHGSELYAMANTTTTTTTTTTSLRQLDIAKGTQNINFFGKLAKY